MICELMIAHPHALQSISREQEYIKGIANLIPSESTHVQDYIAGIKKT